MLISMVFSPCGALARRAEYANSIGPSQIVDRVIEAAPDTQIARETLGQVEADYMGSKSVFDTNLRANADYTRDEFQRSSAFFGTREDNANWNIGADKTLPTGTAASVNWLNNRNQLFGVPTIQGQTVFPTVPIYESIAEFRLSQPMMRNFAGLNDRSTVASAKKAYQSADLQTKYKIALIAHHALSVYWRWVIAYAYMGSWSQAVADSTNFLNITLERRRLGTVEDTDVLAARANLLAKRNGLLRVRRQVVQWETELKKVLGYPEDELYSPYNKYPVMIGTTYKNKNESIAAALENRWDYQAMQEELKRQNINVVSAKNKRWPQLDLVGTLAVNGLTPSYSNTMSNVDNPLWTVGMNFSVPLENHMARADYKKAKHEKSKVVIQLGKMENDISNEIGDLYRRIGINRDILGNAKHQVQMEKDKLYMEIDKYRMGRSGSEMIVLYQNDRLIAELAAYESWADYLQSVLDLKLADNSLIDL